MAKLSATPSRDKNHFTRIITHRMALRDGAKAYALFNSREAIKVVLACQ
jgi:threonine dehydrogenase-like Zn-dependent dehydrogenase